MITLSDTEFESVLADALDEVPQHLLDRLDNVTIEVLDEPSSQQRAASACTQPWHDLLGLYVGVSLTRRGPGYGVTAVLPDRIFIFKEPILRHVGDSDGARELIRRVVLHEIGHYFGLDDARLRELGY